MKTALVTGASSGIGRRICLDLVQDGYEVFGIGRKFEHPDTQVPFFHTLVCDLRDTQALLSLVGQVREKARIDTLIHCAGTAYYGLHEEISPAKIQEMRRVNLEAPLILTQMLLRDMKSAGGTIVFISSVTARRASPHGAAYAAGKAGLSGFAESLFEEVRKFGVRVITVEPDMTRTGLYRHADFETGEEQGSYLTPETVSEAVRFALNRPEGVVLRTLSIRPQIHRIRRKPVKQ